MSTSLLLEGVKRNVNRFWFSCLGFVLPLSLYSLVLVVLVINYGRKISAYRLSVLCWVGY